MTDLQPGGAPPGTPRDWTREFAKPFVHSAVTNAIGSALPDLKAQLAIDPTAYLELLTVSGMLADEAERVLRENVRHARLAGLSWDAIGASLGIDAIAAQQRFSGSESRPTPAIGAALPQHPTNPDLPPIDTLAITEPGLFAGQEIECLNRAGKFGWHAVDQKGSRWTLAFDHRQWQHIFTEGAGTTPYGDGWQQIPGSKRKIYWARPTNLPILPGNPPLKAFVSDRRVKKAVER